VIMVSGARFSWRVQRRVANQAVWVAGDVMPAVPVPAGDMCSAGGSNEGFDQHAVRLGGMVVQGDAGVIGQQRFDG
jgi:hypothetical protein